MVGFVYFIASDQAMLKIGYSADPAMRLKELSTSTAASLTLLGAIPGDFSTEAALHRRFADHHVNREWFRCEPDLLRSINALLELYPNYTAQAHSATNVQSEPKSSDDIRMYDGLTLSEYETRELGRFIRETWPHETFRSAANALGEPLQTIRNWLAGNAFPGGHKLLSLQRRFGLEFHARIDPEPHPDVTQALTHLRRRSIEAEISRLTDRLKSLDQGEG